MDSKKNQYEIQTPNIESDGIDQEYSRELADQEDIEAQHRAEAADRRAKSK